MLNLGVLESPSPHLEKNRDTRVFPGPPSASPPTGRFGKVATDKCQTAACFLTSLAFPLLVSQLSHWIKSLCPSHALPDSSPGPPVVATVLLPLHIPGYRYITCVGVFSHLPNLILVLSQGKLPRLTVVFNKTLNIPGCSVRCPVSALTLQISKSKSAAVSSCTLSHCIRYIIPSHLFSFSSRPLPRLEAKPSPIRTPRRTCAGWRLVSATWCALNTATASTCTATDPGPANTSAPSTADRRRTAPGSALKTGWSR